MTRELGAVKEAFAVVSAAIPRNIVEFTYFAADHVEMIWAKIELCRTVEEVDVHEATARRVPVPASSQPLLLLSPELQD